MPRNGTGTYSLPQAPFVSGTVISSAAMNSDLSDIALALTQSIATNGQTPMTGQLSLASSGFKYTGDPSSGISSGGSGVQNVQASGVTVATFSPTGLNIIGEIELNSSNIFPVGNANIAAGAVGLTTLYQPASTSVLLGTDSNPALTITGAANNGSGAIRLTVANTATFATGESKNVVGVLGTTEANGTWVITVFNSTSIDLQGSTFVNAYTSGGTIGGGFELITLSTGLELTANVLSAPSVPYQGGFKNLAIKVATNTQVTATADAVIVYNGSLYQNVAVTSTINLGTNGGVNALDTGTIAIDTWYFIWVIAQANGTTACLASTSSTSPTMPSGYTFKARIGAVKTIHSSAILYGTWQFGRRVQYIVGLAGTSTAVALATAAAGSTNTPTWVGVTVNGGNVQQSFVPSTASEILVFLSGLGGNETFAMAAPNNSYGQIASTTNPPPLALGGTAAAPGVTIYTTGTADFVLESSSIYYAANATIFLGCLGWIDNI